MDKAVIFFVEGDTEEAFYKKLCETFKQCHCDGAKFAVRYVDIKNLNGIANFGRKVISTIEHNRHSKYRSCTLYPILCYDTDVFELGRKPPVDLDRVENQLNSIREVGGVYRLGAQRTIEDWLLLDVARIREFLRLPAGKTNGMRCGLDEIRALFKQANKTYVKGKAEALIDQLNMNLIIKKKSVVFADVIRLLNTP